MQINRIAGVTMVALLALGLVAVSASAQQRGADTTSLEGKPAPAFSLQTVQGKDMDLAKDKGNVVVLDFWATWCGPCRVSLPHLNELSENKELAEKGLKVYAVNLREDKDTAKGYADQNKLTFAIPLDLKGAVAEKYLVQGIPTTVVVGRDGKIAKVLVGSGKNAELDSAVNDALAAENPRKAAKSG